jgi:hypothetical protein
MVGMVPTEGQRRIHAGAPPVRTPRLPRSRWGSTGQAPRGLGSTTACSLARSIEILSPQTPLRGLLGRMSRPCHAAYIDQGASMAKPPRRLRSTETYARPRSVPHGLVRLRMGLDPLRSQAEVLERKRRISDRTLRLGGDPQLTIGAVAPVNGKSTYPKLLAIAILAVVPSPPPMLDKPETPPADSCIATWRSLIGTATLPKLRLLSVESCARYRWKQMETPG